MWFRSNLEGDSVRSLRTQPNQWPVPLNTISNDGNPLFRSPTPPGRVSKEIPSQTNQKLVCTLEGMHLKGDACSTRHPHFLRLRKSFLRLEVSSKEPHHKNQNLLVECLREPRGGAPIFRRRASNGLLARNSASVYLSTKRQPTRGQGKRSSYVTIH